MMKTDKTDKTAKTVSLVMIIMLAAKIMGLFRDALVLRAFGTGPAAAAFTFASQIPRDFLDAAFASAISASFIPIFNTYLEKKSKKEAFALANNFTTTIAMAATAASLAIFLAANGLANFWLADEAADTIALATRLLRIMSITILLTSLAFSLTGIVQSLGQFTIPAAMSLFSNCIIVGYLLFFGNPGVAGLAIAFVLGNIAQAACIIPPLFRRGFRPRPFIRLNDPGMLQIFRLMPMVLVGSWLFPINSLANSNIAARYSAAAMVQLRAANSLYMVAAGLFTLSLTNVLFPKLSRQAASDPAAFNQNLSAAIRAALIFLAPIGAGLAILAQPIIRLFAGGGEFTPADTAAAAHALRLLNIGIIGFGLQAILSRAFFALHIGKIPMLTSLAAIAINISIAIPLTPILGIGGPAISGAISITAAAAIMLALINRRTQILNRALLILIIKIAISSILMSTGVIISINLMPNAHPLIKTAASTFVGAAIYFAAAYFLKIPEIRAAKSFISGK